MGAVMLVRAVVVAAIYLSLSSLANAQSEEEGVSVATVMLYESKCGKTLSENAKSTLNFMIEEYKIKVESPEFKAITSQIANSDAMKNLPTWCNDTARRYNLN